MSNPSGKKVYGLILPKKQSQGKPQSSTVSNVFGNDSDEDGEASTGPVAPYKVTTSSSKMKRQTQMDIDKALQEDSSIYEYDEVYDQMQANKPQVGRKENEKAKIDRKPKYIAGLLKAAEVKKKEEERRVEKKVQKEREAEGERYADKEKFVTSAYKRKMLEMQEAEEKEKREAAFEAMTDVTKQKDMSGFYRYLYRQQGSGTEDTQSASTAPNSGDMQSRKDARPEESEVKQEPASPTPESVPGEVKQERRDRSLSSSSSSSSSSTAASDVDHATVKSKRDGFPRSQRAIPSGVRRKRQDSSSSSASDSSPQQSTRDSAQRQDLSSQALSDSKSHKSHPANISESKPRRITRSRSKSPAGRGKGISEEKGHRQRRSSSPRFHRGREKEERKRRKSRSPLRRKGDRGREKESPQHEEREERRDSQRLPKKDRGKVEANADPPTKDHDQRRKVKARSRSPVSPPRMSSSKREETGREGTTTKDRVRQPGSPRGADSSDENSTERPGNAGDKGKTNNDRVEAESKRSKKSEPPVDPAKKVYPRHHSAEDVAAARKRYLQRKIARERAALG